MQISSLKTIIIILLFAAGANNTFSQLGVNASRYAENSVLSTGNWYKIKTSEKSFYKLTYDDLKKIGLSDPSKVKIFGYGGNPVETDFSKPYIDDLPELPIWMETGSDNSFGAGDYILFYAQGPVKWTYNLSRNEFIRENNPYSNHAFFFVTEGDGGKRIQPKSSNPSGFTQSVDFFDDYAIHEKDERNLIESGREFYGESFRITTNQNFNFNIPGIIKGTKATINFVSKTPSATPLRVSINGVETLSGSVPQTSNRYFSASEVTLSNSWDGEVKDQNTVNVNFAGNNYENSYLNYIILSSHRKLQPYDAVTFFRNVSSIGKTTQFSISNASAGQIVLDVTDEINPQRINTETAGATAQFISDSEQLNEFAIVDPSKTIPTPEIVGKVENQNLHALQRADMVIIVQPALESYASRLAQMHLDDSGLTSVIVNPEKIYNEFSSGKPDATAYRRFLKMFYDRAQTEEDKPKYLLLFGDGIYDNKLVETNKWRNTNTSALLLTYQSAPSLSETNSFVTDDYFGFLDDNEGTNLAQDKLDLGIGRLPVRNPEEAQGVVTKIEKYLADKDPSIWKNNVLFLADDAIATGNSPQSERVHMVDSDKLAEKINNNQPQFIVNKVYMDAFQRVITGEGARYPDAQKKLFESLNSGQLLINFMGHGSTRDWTHEYILKYADIEKMTNSRLPAWITATCDFSRFDGENYSGGEIALLNPRGGAIALFSTVRLVYASSNMLLATGLFNHIFDKQDGKPLRLGDIMKNAKRENNLSFDSNKLNFALLGDPALRLAYPDENPKVIVTEVNGKPAAGDPATFQALSTVRIKGQIANGGGAVESNFNGFIDSRIFDSRQELTTRDNADAGVALTYYDYMNTIYNGKAEVKNGEFEFSFVVPKDILYSADFGKMSFYAYETNTTKKAHGYFTNYKINGTATDAIEDNTPPEITKMYLNQETFVSGDKTNNTPLLVADVSDNVGLNLSAWHGHEITVTIEGVNKNYLKTFDVTSSFQNTPNSPNSGTIRYLMPHLENGTYKLTMRVWDVNNNSGTQEIEFIVSEDFETKINEFFIYGNPAKERTRFVLATNIPGSEVMVTFNVYNLAGALIWSHQERASTGNAIRNIEYEWNLTARDGSRLRQGVYLVRASVISNGVKEDAKAQKLIIGK